MSRLFPVTTPWYHGWNVVAVGILTQAITIGLITYSFTFWVASFQEDLGASTARIMLAASLSHVALAGISPFCGKWVDSGAVRPIVTSGIVIFCSGYFLVSLCDHIWQVIVLYSTVLPLGAALAGPIPAQVATVRWFARKRGMALGITSLGSSIGGFVFPLLVTFLVASLGWRLSHVILGGCILVLVVPLIWVFVREPDAQDVEPGVADSGESHPSSGSGLAEWTIPLLLRSGVLWALVLSFVPLMAVFLSYKYNLAPIATASGIAPQQASYIMAVHAACAIGGKLLFGFLADRTEHRVLVWMMVAAFLGSLLLPQVSTAYPPLMLSFGLLGLAAGGFLPLLAAIGASRFGPDSIGRVIGLTGPLNMIGSFGPSVFAYLVTVYGAYDPALRILMLLLIPSVVAACFLGPATLIYPPTVKGRQS